MNAARPAYVPKDFAGKCKVFPPTAAMLLPYQQRWVCDNSRLKLGVKSRQIGFSWCSAYRVVRQKIRAGARLDAWISSRDEISAVLFLADAKRWATILNTAATDMGPTLIDDQGNTALTIRLANGLRIHSMTSNPNAQAGKAGSRLLDEFALHNDPRQLYAIAYPGLAWGGNLEIFSSQRGSTNFFNELIREITERRNPKRFSFHRITLADALADGFLYKLQCKLPNDDERMQMDEGDYQNFIRAGCVDEESYLQEFMTIAADDNAAFLPYDLISGAEYSAGAVWETDLLDCKNPLYVGVDIGRTQDLTVIWVVEQINGVHFTRRVIEMSKAPFEEQEAALYEILALASVRRCAIDQSGLGRQFAERAAKKFGAYKVEGINFTQGIKEELAYPVRVALEEHTIKIPFTNAIRADLRAIRRDVTSSGHTRFSGERNAYGHSDRFWSLALCLFAAKTLNTGAITDPSKIYIGKSAPIGRPRFTPRSLAAAPFQGWFQT